MSNSPLPNFPVPSLLGSKLTEGRDKTYYDNSDNSHIVNWIREQKEALVKARKEGTESPEEIPISSSLSRSPRAPKELPPLSAQKLRQMLLRYPSYAKSDAGVRMGLTTPIPAAATKKSKNDGKKRGSAQKVREKGKGKNKGKDDAFIVVVVGDTGVGKTSFVHTLLGLPLPKKYKPTSFHIHSVDSAVVETTNPKAVSKGKGREVEVWDTSGDHEQDYKRGLCYKVASCIVICYSVTDVHSYGNVKERWFTEIQNNSVRGKPVPIILIATKIDRLPSSTKRTSSTPNPFLYAPGEQPTPAPTPTPAPGARGYWDEDAAEAVTTEIGAVWHFALSNGDGGLKVVSSSGGQDKNGGVGGEDRDKILEKCLYYLSHRYVEPTLPKKSPTAVILDKWARYKRDHIDIYNHD